MRLTQKQESLLARFVREVNSHLPEDLPERARERGFVRLQSRMERELNAADGDSIHDEDVAALIERLGDPAEVAASFAARRTAPGTLQLAREDRVWLGVCGGLAEYLDAAPWLVRGFAFVLGLTTGPLALIAYLALYVWLRLAGGEEEPRIAKARVLGRGFGAVALAFALHYGSQYAVRGIYYIEEQYLHRPIPELGDWAWLHVRAGELFFWSLALCTPLAVLSGLPLANAWDYSLKRIVQALLALYGVVLSFGIASILTGLILDFVKEFTG